MSRDSERIKGRRQLPANLIRRNDGPHRRRREEDDCDLQEEIDAALMERYNEAPFNQED